MIEIATPWSERVRVVRLEQDEQPPREWFSDEELGAVSALRLPKRRAEWLSSRAAAKELAVRLGVCSDPRSCRVGRPTLLIDGVPSDWYVSISHSAPYAGAALGRAPVGVDVQVVREIAESSAHLFLSDAEAEMMRRCTLAHRVLHFWCAKEAAWKRGGGEVRTLRQIPLTLVRESAFGVHFDAVDTVAVDDLIVAITT